MAQRDGNATPSIASALLAKLDSAEDQDLYNDMIQRVAGTTFSGAHFHFSHVCYDFSLLRFLGWTAGEDTVSTRTPPSHFPDR